MSNGLRADEMYMKLERLGRGSFGEVFHGVEIATGKDVAIKILDLDIDDDDLGDIRKEISILSRCDSEHITRYHGAFLCGSKLWIIIDYAGGGSLRSILKSGPLTEPAIGVICRQVLEALVYLHKSASVIHRDIKAANILLTSDGFVKLCDFGVAGQMSKSISRRNSFVGTPYWISPEIIKRSNYDYKTDIWSLGITVIELATGNPPFSNHDPRKAILLIANSKPARLDGDFSVALKEFVALCLQEDPSDRPTAEELLKTRFIKNSPTSRSPLVELLVNFKVWKDKYGKEDSYEDNENESIKIPEEDGWIFDSIGTSHPKNSTIKLRSNVPSQFISTITTDNTELEIGWISSQKNEPEVQEIQKDTHSELDYETLKALKISQSKSNPSSPKVIDWDAMIDSANSLLPSSLRDESSKKHKRTSSYPVGFSTSSKTNSSSSESRLYHFNSFEHSRNSDNIRSSWSSKKKMGKNDRFSHGSERDSRFGPKPIDASFFDLNNDGIIDEHNSRKGEFLRLLGSFSAQVESL